jgi:two-component system, NarL family, response regulator LiaR
MTDRIRVLVADDHPTLRAGLRAIIETQDDMEVVGEAGSGEEAVDRAAVLRPDIVLMDLEMPVLDGVEATRQIRERLPNVRVIAFTAFDTDDRIIGAVEAGAQGYLLKGAPREELFRAVRVAHEGGSLLHPAIASKLMRHVSTPHSQKDHDGLSARELEVLALLVEGLTNKEIAARLVVSERTIKFHVGSILNKLDVQNRSGAVRVALEHRLVKRDN